MDKNILENLKAEIRNTQAQIAKIAPKLKNNNKNIESVYNKLLIKKAVLNKKYEKLTTKVTVAEKVQKIFNFGRKKTIISDWFTSEV